MDEPKKDRMLQTLNELAERIRHISHRLEPKPHGDVTALAGMLNAIGRLAGLHTPDDPTEDAESRRTAAIALEGVEDITRQLGQSDERVHILQEMSRIVGELRNDNRP